MKINFCKNCGCFLDYFSDIDGLCKDCFCKINGLKIDSDGNLQRITEADVILQYRDAIMETHEQHGFFHSHLIMEILHERFELGFDSGCASWIDLILLKWEARKLPAKDIAYRVAKRIFETKI